MNPKSDWGTWVSLAAIFGVSIAVGISVVSGSSTPAGAEPVVEGPVAAEAPAEAEQPAKEKKQKGAEQPQPSRRLGTPDATIELPAVLSEISGLSATTDDASLWAVNDEQGSVFRISTKDGSIVQELPLNKVADYEGVEEVNGQVFVARSDGMILVVDPKGGPPVELSFKGKLGQKCDLEGLGFEASKKRLLLACKSATVETRKTSDKSFEIHAMDLESRQLSSEPAFIVTAKAIDDFLEAHPDEGGLEKLKGKSFGPSGLAVNPKTGEINVLSSMGQMLVVLDPKGAVVRIEPLDRSVHAQPEGITFGADGTLFISNEARGKKPMLHRFKPAAGKS